MEHDEPLEEDGCLWSQDAESEVSGELKSKASV